MDNQALHDIRVRAAESRLQIATVNSLLPLEAPPSLRAYFARCAISLALEHHLAIVTCMETGLFGSAAALVRPLLEASTIAYWVMYAASCQHIESLPATPDAIRLGSPDVPQLTKMLALLGPTFPQTKELLAAFNGKGKARWLDQFTHGGIPQLVRRSTGWSHEHVLLTVVVSDLFGIMGPCLESVIAPTSSSAIASYGFERRDSLNEELSRITGEPTAKAPTQLPAPLTTGCGPAPSR